MKTHSSKSPRIRSFFLLDPIVVVNGKEECQSQPSRRQFSLLKEEFNSLVKQHRVKLKPLVQTPAACLLLLRIRSLKQTLVATRASCNSAAGPRETKSKIRNSGLQTSSNLFDPHSHWDLFASPYAPMAPCNPKTRRHSSVFVPGLPNPSQTPQGITVTLWQRLLDTFNLLS